jgi:hypothetical protein
MDEIVKGVLVWAPIVTPITAMTIAAVGFFYVVKTYRSNSRTNRAKFVFDLTESFLKEKELREFWYRLDYDSWKFILNIFRHSQDERLLDTLLYKFVVIGRMLRSGAISVQDIEGLFVMCRQTFGNHEVQDYLRFHKLDFWHTQRLQTYTFRDALYLYGAITNHLVKTGRADKQSYKRYQNFVNELDSIPTNRLLQRQIALKIGYDLDEKLPV